MPAFGQLLDFTGQYRQALIMQQTFVRLLRIARCREMTVKLNISIYDNIYSRIILMTL